MRLWWIMKKRFCVGIFGGSFNPPHLGHVRAAKSFCDAAQPDVLMVIPSFMPPHKVLDEVGADKRLEMARLAFSGVYGCVEISDCEITRGGKSYTLYTVQEILGKYPECDIALYVGSDMLMSFDTWHKAEELFRLCRLYVMPRFDDRVLLEQKAEQYRKEYNAEIVFIDGPFYEISSTQLRRAVKENDKLFLNENLPEDVLLYLQKEKLYLKG